MQPGTHVHDAPQYPRSVVCFGGEDWWYHNRGHCDMQFMRQFAKHVPVLYVNSIVIRKPNFSEGPVFWQRLQRKARSIFRGLRQVSERFWVFSPVTAPVHHIPGFRVINDIAIRLQTRGVMRRLTMQKPLVWVNCPGACFAALALPRCGLVYQRTDRFEDFPGIDAHRVSLYDRMLRERADLTFYCNRSLYEEERETCRAALYVEHGVDYERFAQPSSDVALPADIADLPRPIAGFFGAIDTHKFDLDLAVRVAGELPGFSFVFIGEASIDCSALSALPNVSMVGRIPYERIPDYGRVFDVCLMPFKSNAWIEAFSPIKLKEYLALGKPIVTTGFPELSEYAELVYVGEDARRFAECVARAVREDSVSMQQKRRQRVSGHSWESKAQLVVRALAGVR